MSTRLEILKKYLQEDPDDSFLHYALALEFIALNDLHQACKELEKLALTNPEYLPTYYMAGKTNEALHQFDQAKEWYEKGVELAKRQNELHTLNELLAALEGMD